MEHFISCTLLSPLLRPHSHPWSVSWQQEQLNGRMKCPSEIFRTNLWCFFLYSCTFLRTVSLDPKWKKSRARTMISSSLCVVANFQGTEVLCSAVKGATVQRHTGSDDWRPKAFPHWNFNFLFRVVYSSNIYICWLQKLFQIVFQSIFNWNN